MESVGRGFPGFPCFITLSAKNPVVPTNIFHVSYIYMFKSRCTYIHCFIPFFKLFKLAKIIFSVKALSVFLKVFRQPGANGCLQVRGIGPLTLKFWAWCYDHSPPATPYMLNSGCVYQHISMCAYPTCSYCKV